MHSYFSNEGYLTTSIQTSDPLELTLMLYRAAIESIQNAQLAIENNQPNEQNKQITKAQQVIAELCISLKPEHAPELSMRLAQLYEYVLHLIQQGNFEKKTAPLTEAQSLLKTIQSGWEECRINQEATSRETVAA